jgi:hypothetical protein
MVCKRVAPRTQTLENARDDVFDNAEAVTRLEINLLTVYAHKTIDRYLGLPTLGCLQTHLVG